MSTAVFTLARDMADIRARTRLHQGTSLVLHGVLIAWLVLHHSLTPHPEQLVEVSWNEPAPVAPAAVAEAPPQQVAVAAPEPAPVTTTAVREARFERKPETGPQAPHPQDAMATRDAVRARLEAMQASESTRAVLAAASGQGSRIAAAAAPAAVAGQTGVASRELERGPSLASAQPLARGKAPAHRQALPVAAPVQSALSRATAESPVKATTEKILGSARLSGEVADRPVVHYEMPTYPDWATRDAVEADVTLRFAVLADGRIKDSVQVERTAGFLDFDDAAVAALRRWRFAALPAGQNVEQWGSITFHFRLRDRP